MQGTTSTLPASPAISEDPVISANFRFRWANEHRVRGIATNLDVVDLGHCTHFLRETHPDPIGRAISSWLANL